MNRYYNDDFFDEEYIENDDSEEIETSPQDTPEDLSTYYFLDNLFYEVIDYVKKHNRSLLGNACQEDFIKLIKNKLHL